MKRIRPLNIAKETIDAMRERLGTIGFAPADVPWEKLFEVSRYRLRRELEWKVEEISIFYRTAGVSDLTLERRVAQVVSTWGID